MEKKKLSRMGRERRGREGGKGTMSMLVTIYSVIMNMYDTHAAPGG